MAAILQRAVTASPDSQKSATAAAWRADSFHFKTAGVLGRRGKRFNVNRPIRTPRRDVTSYEITTLSKITVAERFILKRRRPCGCKIGMSVTIIYIVEGLFGKIRG